MHLPSWLGNLDENIRVRVFHQNLDCHFTFLHWFSVQAFVLKQKGSLMELVDPNLGTEFNEKEAERMIKAALLCTNASSKLRPTMSAVLRMLEGQDIIPEVISDPSIYGKDMRISPLRDHYQHMEMQSSSGSLAPNFSLDGAQVGSSSSA